MIIIIVIDYYDNNYVYNFKIYISYTDYNNIDYIDKVNLITKNIYSNNKFKY